MCKIYDWLHNNAISKTSRNNHNFLNILGICWHSPSIHALLFFLWTCAPLVSSNNENHTPKVSLKREFLPFRQHAFWQSSWLLTWVSDRYLGSWSFFIWSTLTHWLFRVAVTSQWLAIARLMKAVTANMTPYSDVIMLNVVLAFD